MLLVSSSDTKAKPGLDTKARVCRTAKCWDCANDQHMPPGLQKCMCSTKARQRMARRGNSDRAGASDLSKVNHSLVTNAILVHVCLEFTSYGWRCAGEVRVEVKMNSGHTVGYQRIRLHSTYVLVSQWTPTKQLSGAAIRLIAYGQYRHCAKKLNLPAGPIACSYWTIQAVDKENVASCPVKRHSAPLK